MAFQLPGIDLNPRAGDSFLGLTRIQSRTLAKIFLIIGLFLALPPFVPDPTDIFTLWLAKEISGKFSLPLLSVLGFTYIFGIILIILGAYIYPYNTRSLLNGYISKARTFVRREIKNPRSVIIAVIVLFFLYTWYTNQIAGGLV